MNHRVRTATCLSLILAALGCGGSSSVLAPRDSSVQSGGDGASTNSPDAQTDAIAEGGGDRDAATDAGSGDAAAPTCHACAVKNCPTQVAACGPGSSCSAFLQCSLACSSDGGSNCSNTCDAMDPSGETAYAALTLCDLGPCGAGCVALLAVQGP
jgi:hypothetical protein